MNDNRIPLHKFKNKNSCINNILCLEIMSNIKQKL